MNKLLNAVEQMPQPHGPVYPPTETQRKGFKRRKVCPGYMLKRVGNTFRSATGTTYIRDWAGNLVRINPD